MFDDLKTKSVGYYLIHLLLLTKLACI